jgi:hypothetical protein
MREKEARMDAYQDHLRWQRERPRVTVLDKVSAAGGDLDWGDAEDAAREADATIERLRAVVNDIADFVGDGTGFDECEFRVIRPIIEFLECLQPGDLGDEP